MPTSLGYWKVRRRDVRTAIRRSNNSMPGPDGIPYKAWRKLGELGVEIIFGMVKELAGGDGEELLRGAYHDEEVEEGGSHNFCERGAVGPF